MAWPDWLTPTHDEFTAAVRADRRAHAYLLSGPAGVGKRVLAAAMARTVLGADAPAGHPGWPNRADFHRIAPAEDKTALSVEQVRGLIGELAMTSFEGGSKVAVIEAADTMSMAAANALLKTLEEPPGDSCLILVADRLLNLPATILSRCVHIRVAVPPAPVALAWLQAPDDTVAERTLALAGGAPCLARRWLDDGTADTWAPAGRRLRDTAGVCRRPCSAGGAVVASGRSAGTPVSARDGRVGYPRGARYRAICTDLPAGRTICGRTRRRARALLLSRSTSARVGAAEGRLQRTGCRGDAAAGLARRFSIDQRRNTCTACCGPTIVARKDA